MIRADAVVLAVLLVAGCAQTIAEPRVRNALTNAGVPEPIAACMAGRMVDRLSVAQLRRLEELQHPSAETPADSLSDYLMRVRRVGDPEVIGVTSSSAALCGTGLAR